MIEPFEIPGFTSAQLSDLHHRLDNTIYPNELATEVGNGWEYGTPRNRLEPLIQEWRHDYDFEKARSEMNQWKQFKLTTKQGLKLHFIHEPSKKPNAIPIILVHGWPSSCYEFHKVINPLRDGSQDGQAYHVVVPSLPGYGFSDPPSTPGFGIAKMGEVLNELMLELGYSKYMSHGTDWGSTITHEMVTRYEKHCSAAHFTMFLCAPPLPTLTNLWYHPVKVARFLLGALLGFDRVYGVGQFNLKGNNFADVMNDSEAGYRAIQGTKPYTLAFSLSDSPAGLLGWILEKYHTYSYHQDQAQSLTLPSTLPANEVLTQASIYWLTNTMSSSIRLYYETLSQIKFEGLKMFGYVKNPIGISAFQGEVLRVPKDWMEAAGDLRFLNEHPLGGHFAAMEEPELLVADIQTFGKKVAYLFH